MREKRKRKESRQKESKERESMKVKNCIGEEKRLDGVERNRRGKNLVLMQLYLKGQSHAKRVSTKGLKYVVY